MKPAHIISLNVPQNSPTSRATYFLCVFMCVFVCAHVCKVQSILSDCAIGESAVAVSSICD